MRLHLHMFFLTYLLHSSLCLTYAFLSSRCIPAPDIPILRILFLGTMLSVASSVVSLPRSYPMFILYWTIFNTNATVYCCVLAKVVSHVDSI